MSSAVDVVHKAKDLGISNVEKPSAADMKVFFNAYLKNKLLDNNMFKAIAAHLNPSLPIVFDGLKAFSHDQMPISKNTQKIIQLAIGILQQELARPTLSAEQRPQILNRVFDLVIEARQEGKENRGFLLTLAGIGAGITTVVSTGVVFALRKK